MCGSLIEKLVSCGLRNKDYDDEDDGDADMAFCLLHSSAPISLRILSRCTVLARSHFLLLCRCAQLCPGRIEMYGCLRACPYDVHATGYDGHIGAYLC